MSATEMSIADKDRPDHSFLSIFDGRKTTFDRNTTLSRSRKFAEQILSPFLILAWMSGSGTPGSRWPPVPFELLKGFSTGQKVRISQ